MSNEEPTPGQTEKELELEAGIPTDPQGDDPLDFVLDLEELRNEAKKFRSIAQRKAKKDEVKELPKVEKKAEVLPTHDFVRKSDLERAATNKAKTLIGADIAAEYNELTKIELGGFDSLDPESIAQNLRERYAILKGRKPVIEKKEDISELSATKVVAGTGTGSDKESKSEVKNPPNFSIPRKPKDWY